MPVLTKIPTWLQVYNKDICWKVPQAENNLYLTFDDGPHPICTPLVLDILKDLNIKASFFCVGKQVRLYPEIYQRILKEGHQVGNHSFSHLNGWKTHTDDYLSDVVLAEELINSSLFRPPYGRITPTQFKALKSNFKIVMWDVLSQDYDSTISNAQVIQNVVLGVSKGSIVVLHDNEKTTNRISLILPEIINQLHDRGWSFKTL